MAVVKNMMVRVGADFSSLITQSKTASAATNQWANVMSRSFRLASTSAASWSAQQFSTFNKTGLNTTSLLQRFIQNFLRANKTASASANQSANAIKRVAESTSGLQRASSRVNIFSLSLKALGIYSLKLYALAKAFTFLKDSVTKASDLTEIQNVVDTAFGSLAYKAEDFAASASQTYGLTAGQAKKFSSNYMAMATSMGVAKDAAADMSIQLAALAGDVASFYNIDQEEAYTKLRSVFTGTIRPMTDLGVAMTVANLEAYALSRGITSSWESMSQAEKIMLRYQYAMDSLSISHGDFAKTSHTWANQVRLLQNNFTALKSVVGTGLIAVLSPFLRGLNSAMSALVSFGNAVSSVFSSVFGTKQTTLSGAFDFSDLGDDVDDLTTSEKGASSAAKELKRQLMGFDEITKLGDTSSGSGSGGGSSVSGGLAGLDTSLMDEAVEQTTRFSGEMEKFKNFLNGLNFGPIQRAWGRLRDGAKRLSDILGGALQWGLEHVLEPLAKWTIEEAAPAALDTLATALETVSDALIVLKPVWDWAWKYIFKPLGKAFGDAFVNGLNDLNTALSNLDGYLKDIRAVMEGKKTLGEMMKSWLSIDRISADLKDFSGIAEHCLNSIGLLIGMPNAGTNIISLKVQLEEGANEIWAKFKSAWNSGSKKAVEIWNSLVNSAGTLWQNFKTAWGNSRAVQIWNSLVSSAGTLWQNFKAAWGNSRAVQIWNSLVSSAGTLWQNFKAAWGSGKGVTIVNTLLSSAQELWEKFKKGWSGKTLGLKLTYKTDVSGVKKAVYKALGLSGWPTISFAARGGIVKAATLLGNTVVGEAGKEAIVPLENHTEWLDLVAGRITRAIGGGDGGGVRQPVVIYLTLNGRVISQTVIDDINSRAKNTGVNPLAAWM